MPSYALQNRPQRKKSYRGKLPKLRQSAKKPFIIGFGILLLLIVISVVTAVVVTNNKGMFFFKHVYHPGQEYVSRTESCSIRQHIAVYVHVMLNTGI